jgi:pimeloyl-ACP methyl ester carboxylesterase
MEAVVEPTLARWFTPGFRAAGGDAATRDRLLADDPASWAAAWRAIAGLDLASRLGGVRVPTLCVAGALDPAAPPPVLEAIAAAIPGARLAVLPQAPHMMQIETPDAFAAAVAGFVAGLPADRPQVL